MSERDRAVRKREAEINDGFSELEDYWPESRLPRCGEDSDIEPSGEPRQIRDAFAVVVERLGEDMAHPEFQKCESPIEQLFFRAFRARHPGVPILSQVSIGSFRVDFLIGRRTIVECDGAPYHHANERQIERDEARNAKLRAAGYVVFRFSGREIVGNVAACLEAMAAFLSGSREL